MAVYEIHFSFTDLIEGIFITDILFVHYNHIKQLQYDAKDANGQTAVSARLQRHLIPTVHCVVTFCSVHLLSGFVGPLLPDKWRTAFLCTMWVISGT